MSRFRLPSSKEMEVLQMLISQGDMYGLQMVKSSDCLKRGTVYVVLSRMEEKGFVKSRQIHDDTAGLPKRLYSVTGLGQRAYAARQMAKMMLTPALGLVEADS